MDLNKIYGHARSPRNIQVEGRILVLTPFSLGDLPPDGVVGSFVGVAVLRFSAHLGTIAVFQHDLEQSDVIRALTAHRRPAEAQLRPGSARRGHWWAGVSAKTELLVSIGPASRDDSAAKLVPAPLVPAEVDLLDFDFAPVEVDWLRMSGTSAEYPGHDLRRAEFEWGAV